MTPTIGCAYCRAPFGIPPTLLQTGGCISCPSCGQPNVVGVAVQAPINVRPAAVPPRPSTRPKIAAPEAWGLIAFFSLALAGLIPPFGIGIAVVVLVAVGLWLSKRNLRPVINKLVFITKFSSAKQWLMCLAAAVWACLLLTVSIGVIAARIEADREEAKATEQRKVAEAERLKKRASLISQAEASVEAGELDDARKQLDQARQLGTNGALTEVSQQLDRQLREREVAKLPGLLREVTTANKSEDWDAALALCAEAETIDREFEGLKLACSSSREGKRISLLPARIESALAVADDEGKCDTPLEIADAWKGLQEVKSTDSQFRKAQRAASKLERCRKKIERHISKGIRDTMVSQRENWASNYESSLLDSGVDTRVTLRGKYKDRIKIKWVLLSRARVHQITKDGTFLAGLEKAGFTRVTFSDGYYESWYYDLSPESEVGGGKSVLRNMGLDGPLSLD